MTSDMLDARPRGVRGRLGRGVVERVGVRLFALGLLQSRRVSVGRSDGGEVLRVRALPRGRRFPDPTVGSNGLPSWNDSWSMNAKTQAEALPAAQRACRKDLPELGPHTSAEKAAANAEALKYATCMRSNGASSFPDPNGQGVIQISNATGSLDPASPQFQKAAAACKSLENGFGEASSVATPG